MKPIKPKFQGTVKVEWRISKRAKEIISEYSKYTKYEESEIIDKLISEIIEDEDFVNWLKKKRYKKKVEGLLFTGMELDGFEEIEQSEDEVFLDEQDDAT
jgi:hypothetical protein